MEETISFNPMDYERLIKKMAYKCYNKIRGNNSIELSDLIQDGFAIVIERVNKYYDESKAGLSTFIYIVLKSYYGNFLKAEIKRLRVLDTQSGYYFKKEKNIRVAVSDNSDEDNVFDWISYIQCHEWHQPQNAYILKRSLDNLSPDALRVVNVIFDIPQDLFRSMRRERRYRESRKLYGHKNMTLKKAMFLKYLGIKAHKFKKIQLELKKNFII